ncbi:MAG: T9SS type A sorting domain-containing protein [Saprospiraceae bacterium]|nr:T9SS type A sorting domain-containing protein [Saprospiraceae bacterium]
MNLKIIGILSLLWCMSIVVSVAQPTVNLGNDTTICGTTLLLDAANPGAAFSWQDGSTNQTFTVATSGIYWVDVTDGGGTTRDSIEVTLNPTVTFSLSDTSICEGNYDIQVNGTTGPNIFYFWWDAPTGGTILNTGMNWSQYFTSSVSYYVESASILGTDSVGLAQPNLAAGGYFNFDRGIAFDVLESLVLESVTVYSQGTGTVDVRITDNIGATVYLGTHNVTAGSNILMINQLLPTGTDYDILLENIPSTAKCFVQTSGSNYSSLTYPFLDMTSSSLLSSGAGSQHVNFFFNWKVQRLGCTSTRDQVNITVLPTPQVSLPSDTFSCGLPIVLDATYPGATYSWSTGASTSDITLSTPGASQIVVTTSLAGCDDIDTTNVLIVGVPNFTVSDTNICEGSYTIEIQGDTADGLFLWWDAAVGGNILNTGTSLSQYFNNSTSYYIESTSVINTDSVGLSVPDFGAGNYFNFNRGILFDVLESLILESVTVYSQGTGTVDVRIVDDIGTTVYLGTYNVVAGANILDIGSLLVPANDYAITLENISAGAKCFVQTSGSNYTNLTYPFLDMTSSTISGSQHVNFFFNWKVQRLGCTSIREQVDITVLPTPQLNFLTDTLVCGNEIVLDASVSGASSYQWCSGETTSAITLTQSDSVCLVAGIGICEDSASIRVTILDTANFVVTDISTCGGNIDLIVQGTPDYEYLWWDASSNGNFLGFGDTLSQILYDTAIYYIEGNSVLDTFMAGLIDYTALSLNSSAFFYDLPSASFSERGLRFDVHQEFLWKSVNIPADGYLQAEIVLYRNGAEVLGTRRNLEFFTGNNIISLDWYLEVDNGYEVFLENPQGGGGLFIDNPLTNSQFPSNDFVTVNAGLPFSNRYNYFYDWVCLDLACPTSRQVMNVNILPTPIPNLPSDTIICGTNYTLDVTETNPLTTYTWSTGSNSPILSLSQDITAVVTVTIGTCTVVDSTSLVFTAPPLSVITPNDITLCKDTVTLHASGDAYTHLWYDNEFAAIPIGVGDSLLYNAEDSVQLWVEGVNFIQSLETYGQITDQPLSGGSYNDPNGGGYSNRGIIFDVTNPVAIILDGFTIHTDNVVTADIQLRNNLGQILYSMTVNMQAGQNDITVNWLIEEGNSYELLLLNATGGNIYVRDLGTTSNMLHAYDDIVIQSTTPSIFGKFYHYFFDWKISTPSCPTQRYSVDVNVLPFPELDLVADTAACAASSVGIQATSLPLPNYSYVWNTGATTNTITVGTSGYYTVTASYDNLCETEKDIFVQVLNLPSTLAAPDLSICASQTVDLLNDPADEIILWQDDTGNPVYISAPYSPFVDSSQFFYPQAYAKATTRVGLQEAPIDAIYLNSITGNTFDVFEYTVLDSVAMYIETGPETFDIVLMDIAGNILETTTVTVDIPKTKTFIPLGFVIPPGTGYNLVFSNASTTLKFLVDVSTIPPLTTSSNIATLTGSSLGYNYSNFYDWHFSYAYPTCTVAPDTFAVDVVLPLVLNDSVYVCDSLILDVSSPLATSYNWSTGATTPTEVLVDAGIYSVTVSDGAGCIAIDTITIGKPMGVGFPSSGEVCQGILTTAYEGTGASFQWSTGDTTEFITGVQIGSTYTVTITAVDGCIVTDQVTITGLTSEPPIDLTPLGQTTLEGCDTIQIDAGFGGLGYDYVWSNGDTGQIIDVTQTGFYSVTVTTPTGCVGSDGVDVELINYPTAFFDYSLLLPNTTIVGFDNLSQDATSYTWYIGDTTNVNTTFSPNFQFPVDSCYEVTLIAENTCGTDTFSTIVVINVDSTFCTDSDTSDTTSIVQLAAVDLSWKVYPNPNKGTFFLEYKGKQLPDGILKIVDLRGQLLYQEFLSNVHKGSVLEIQLADLPTGVYVLHLHESKGDFIERFIIQRE